MPLWDTTIDENNIAYLQGKAKQLDKISQK